MHNKFPLHLIVMLSSTLMLSIMFGGCVPAAQSPQAIVSVEGKMAQSPSACQPLQPVETPSAVFSADATKCYVDRQVLVIGLKGYLSSDQDALKGLKPLQVLDFAAVLDRIDNKSLEIPYFPANRVAAEGLISVLYEIPPNRGTVSQVVSEINGAAKGEAVADPNYLIGEPGIEGHPYGVVGSPYGVVGSPSGGAAKAPDAFLGQWAFKQIGVAPSGTGSSEAGGIPIGLFDTFPEVMPTESVSGYELSVRHNGVTKADLHLCVKIPTTHAVVTPVNPTSVADHGVFAGYLAQAVAPHSKISLYQVLNEYGDGDLATLNRSLLDFIMTTENAKPGVINLSLGVKRYEDQNSAGSGIKWPAGCGSWIPDFANIEAQEVIVHLARQLGFVVVAASGNAGAGGPDYPASLPSVISAGASNSSGQKSCFSNAPAAAPGMRGVLAPGGQGRQVTQTPCAPPVADCTATNDCDDYGLISLVHPKTSSSGYAYWAGTSFAAPLVSGLAARVLETKSGSPPDQNLADAAWSSIECGLAGGVIYAAKSLDASCLSATPEPPPTTTPIPTQTPVP
jgi:hypothetical protein